MFIGILKDLIFIGRIVSKLFKNIFRSHSEIMSIKKQTKPTILHADDFDKQFDPNLLVVQEVNEVISKNFTIDAKVMYNGQPLKLKFKRERALFAIKKNRKYDALNLSIDDSGNLHSVLLSIFENIETYYDDDAQFFTFNKDWNGHEYVDISYRLKNQKKEIWTEMYRGGEDGEKPTQLTVSPSDIHEVVTKYSRHSGLLDLSQISIGKGGSYKWAIQLVLDIVYESVEDETTTQLDLLDEDDY